jgi:Flp pilus assembly protein TadB
MCLVARHLLPEGRMSAHQHNSPVRDQSSAGPKPALAKEPDGVPHDVVGLSALFSVLFAAVVLGMWLSGPTGRIAAVVTCMVGVPMLVSQLRQRSERERNEYNLSR